MARRIRPAPRIATDYRIRVQNMDVRVVPLRVVVLAIALAACSTASTQEPVQLIYSDDAADPWNRLFSIMFTRSVVHRKTSEFADAGPFTKLGENDFRLFPVSTRTFERFEDGDRAVTPFYPSFILIQGHPNPLSAERVDAFARALTDALADSRTRTPVERVLMQHDLWAVFDRLSAADPRLPRIAQMIRKIALSTGEIAGFPDQYALARRALDMPDLFSPGSPWQEIVWYDGRMHDRDVGYRQATRVFLQTDAAVTDRRALVNELRLGGDRGMQAFAKVTGATLLMQMLAIDRDGEIVPTPLVYTVQTRIFAKGPDGKPATIATEHELSRRLFRTQSGSGGLHTFAAGDPAYIPSAGNDYSFATPHFGRVREPILGTLATRCTTCHGAGPHLFTFSVAAPVDVAPKQPVRLLAQPNDDRVRFAIAQKKTREDYKRLRALFLEATGSRYF
jgi:hypothetical protein